MWVAEDLENLENYKIKIHMSEWNYHLVIAQKGDFAVFH